MATKVTDPAILAQLNGGASAAAAGPRKVTDPALLEQLNAQSDAAPTGLRPGSREYADWAVQRAKAGKDLPRVSEPPPAWEAPWVTPGEGRGGIPIISDVARSLYPFERNVESGELRPAVPKIIPALIDGAIDAFTLPSDVAKGKVDPLSDVGVQRGMNFAAALGTGGLKGGVMPSIPKASRNVARALKDDGMRSADLLQQLGNLGDGAMVMDLGPNLQRQAGALASLPGQAQKTVREAVGERAVGAGARVEGDVAATIGTSPDIAKLADDISTSQKAAADPLYTAVRDVQIQVPPAMAFIAKSPMGQQAFNQAKRLAANEGYTAEGMTVGLVDYAKRALDDIATSAAREGKNNIARQARNMTNALTSSVDAQVPGYKAARDAYAGPARVLDALEEGQKSFSREMSPAQLKSTLDGLSPSERDAFLAGAQGSIEAMLGNAINEPLALRNTFRKGWNEHKLRTLLGDEIADDLLKRIDREATFSKTRDVVTGNSETAARTAAQRDVDPATGGKLHQVTAIGALLAGIEKARAMYRGKVQPRVNQDMARGLTSDARSVSPSFISEVDRAMSSQPLLPSAMRDLVRAYAVQQPTDLDQLRALAFR